VEVSLSQVRQCWPCVGGCVVYKTDEGSYGARIGTCSLQILQHWKLLLQGKVVLLTLLLCHCSVLLVSSRFSNGGNNKCIALFIHGNDACGAPSIGATSQFPNQPIG
jgi:hypothetical protein